MVARDVADHYLLEAQPAVVPEPLDHGVRAAYEELGLARTAIALGEDLVHLGVGRGVARCHEDVAPKHGAHRTPGARGSLAVEVELAQELVVDHILAGEPAVAERARALHRGRHRAGEPDLHGDARERAYAHAVEGEVASVKGHPLPREERA